MPLIKFIIICGLSASLAYAWFYTDYLDIIESQAPYIEEIEIPEFIGKEVGSLNIIAKDKKSGIKRFTLTISQNDKTLSLEDVIYTDPVKTHISVPEVKNLINELNEGTAKLIISITDASIWKNQFVKELDIRLDFKSPSLSIRSQQHLAVEGGAEFVILEASDTNLIEVGVSIDSYFFEGVKLSNLEPSLSETNLYGVLFAIPLEVDTLYPLAYAKDSAGNKSLIPLNFRIKRTPLKQTSPKISLGFIEEKVKPLFEEYLSTLEPEERKEINTNDPIKVFSTVNESYRNYLQDKVSKLKYNETSFPSGAFIKPMASATTSNFGELRTYYLEGAYASKSRHDGLDLASVKNDAVIASHNGRVIFSGSLGIYGNTIIIDHGLKLSSLYGHLSSSSVNEGDIVTQGQEIGKSGVSGLAAGDHLHFEFRINNIPVTPKEWWDAHWIEDHVVNKIKAVLANK